METALLDRVHTTFQKQGADAAIAELCRQLQDAKDYQGLFYALLMKKRHELGVSPIPTGSNQDLPEGVQVAFEDGIREACRTVGNLFLKEGQLGPAFGYFRMIGEVQPVAAALEAMNPTEDDDWQPIIDIAFHQGVLPTRGFEWLLKRFGICSAITTMSSGELPFSLETKQFCVKLLLRTLHGELMERLKNEIKNKQSFEPTAKTIKELIVGRDWLFADEFYHIDLSHLNAVIQMSGQLDACDEMRLARDLCAYGQKLSPKFQYPTDPPFENLYVDYDAYLSILLGEDVETGLAHFRQKAADADPETVGPYPAEVLVNLLLRLRRPKEALEISRKYLINSGEGRNACPSFVDLCQLTGDFQALAEEAKAQGHGVNFLAGLLAGAKK